MIAICFGSSYYHLNPNHARLMWHCLPMTVTFASLVAILTTERIHAQKGKISMIPLLSVVIVSTLYFRNIWNLVGYCCDDASRVLLFDYPCKGTLEINLQCHEFVQKLGWRARWCIALEIGVSLRYLHEECTDGAIVHHSVGVSHIFLSHGHSALLSNFATAKWLKDDVNHNEDFTDESSNVANDERFFIDVYDYGKFLVELISGESTSCFQKQGKDSGKTLIEWALPLIENGLLSQVMDSRPMESISDIKLVENMANAAIHCLKIFSSHKLSVDEALAIVRGNEPVN